MKLIYAIPATFAEISGGKLNILGGEFNTLSFATFPAYQMTLALICKFQAEMAESFVMHKAHVTVSDQRGDPIAPDGYLDLSLQRFTKSSGGDYKTLGLVLNYQGITFPKPDIYTFHITLDETELGSVAIDVIESNEPSITLATTFSDAITESAGS